MESEIQSVAGVQGIQHRVYTVAISEPTSFSPRGVEIPFKSSERQHIPHGIGIQVFNPYQWYIYHLGRLFCYIV